MYNKSMSATELEAPIKPEVIQKRIENPSELPRTSEQQEELKGYLEKVESNTEVPVTDSKTGQVLLDPTQQQKAIVIPVTPEEMKEADKLSDTDSVRWYRKWWERIAKMATNLGKTIIFKR